MLAPEFGTCHPSTGRCSSFSRCCSWRLPGQFFRVTPLEEDAFITFVKDHFPSLLHFIGVTNTLKLIPAARQESEDSKTSWPKLLVFVSGQVRCQCSVSRHIVFYCYARAAVLESLGVSISVGGCFFKLLHLNQCINVFSCECASVQYVRSK